MIHVCLDTVTQVLQERDNPSGVVSSEHVLAERSGLILVSNCWHVTSHHIKPNAHFKEHDVGIEN